MKKMLEALSPPFQGLTFRFDRDQDWYFTDEARRQPGLLS